MSGGNGAFQRARRAVAALVVLLSMVVPVLPAAADHGSPKRVLLISSYSPSFPTFFKQVDGVRQGLASAGFTSRTMVLDIEFMDSKRFPSPRHQEMFRASLAAKLAGNPPYDVVLLADDVAFQFGRAEQVRLLGGSPLVFFGVNDRKAAMAASGSPGVTGVVEATSMAETLSVIEALRPNAVDFFVIGAAEVSSRANFAEFQARKSVLKRMTGHVLSLQELTYDDLATRLRTVPRESAVLLFGPYRDKTGETKSYLEGLALILENTQAPVFSLWEHGLGKGVLGGKIISHREQGRVAGTMAAQILKGTAPSAIPVRTDSPNLFVFDYNVMKVHGIAVDSLPPGTTVLNQPEGWIEKNQRWLPWVVAFLLVQSAVIAYLILNIRKRRQAERRARESETRFRDLAQASSDWIWETDVQGRFTFLSDRFERVTGFKVADRLGTTRDDYLVRDAGGWREYKQAIDRRQPFRNLEYATTATADGRVRWVRISGSPVFDADGAFKGFRGTGSDISREVEARNEIVAAREQAEMSNRAKSEFLAHMSHELRTPLNGIIGFAELMSTELYGPLGNSKYREYADNIRGAGTHLLEVLNDILDLSRIEAGAVALDEQPVDLRETVKATLKWVGEMAKARNLTLASAMPGDLPLLRADPRRLKQLFVNLVSNSIKFSQPGGEIKVTAGVAEDGGLWVTVADRGIGIPEQHLDYVRKPFARVEGHMVRSFEGVGLGLPIAESIMAIHGGTMTIVSTENVGTTVTLHFPAARVLDRPAGTEAAAGALAAGLS